jgi:ribosomal protein S28E/S33
MPVYLRDRAAPLVLDEPKDPQGTLDYVFDWKARTNGTDPAGKDWLGPDEVISDHTITPDTGITLDSDTRVDVVVHDGEGNLIELADNTGVRLWLSGGTAGESYDVACEITTDQGRTDERTIRVPVRER